MTWVWKVAVEAIAEVVWQTTSADKAYRLLRERGHDVTRTDVRGAWREYNVKTAYEGPISQWPPERKIPRAWVVERETKEATGFMHLIKYEVYNPGTGERETRFWSIVRDTLTPYAEFVEQTEHDVQVSLLASGEQLLRMWRGGVLKLTPGR